MQTDSNDRNLLCDPAGESPDPVKVGHQREPSVAWSGFDAYTGCR